MNRTALLLLTLAWTSGACNWLSLAKNSLTYRTTQRGETANLVAHDAWVYATLGEDGIAVVDATSGRTVTTIAPASGASIDDVALARDLLFALDARPPGHLSVYSLTDPAHPRLLRESHDVPVGPFSGVSAANGLCVVSGGTSQLTIWRYDVQGSLTGPLATTDLGRGQPDVLITPSGVVYVSTHYRGPYFGLDVVRFDSGRSRLDKLAELPLDGAGFTEGGAKPANFPIESALLGDDTLLIASARGIDVIDVSAPAHPRVVATIDVAGPAINVDVNGSVAAVTVGGEAPALVLLDFGMAPPQQRRVELPVGTIPAGVALEGPRAAVAAGKAGVLFFTR
jgi:hypothetical protein